MPRCRRRLKLLRPKLKRPFFLQLSKKERRAAKIKEVDAKVVKLNKQYASRTHSKVQRKAKVVHKKVHTKVRKKAKATQTKAQETFFLQLSKKEKRAAKIKEVDAKVVKLNKQFASRKHN